MKISDIDYNSLPKNQKCPLCSEDLSYVKEEGHYDRWCCNAHPDWEVSFYNIPYDPKPLILLFRLQKNKELWAYFNMTNKGTFLHSRNSDRTSSREVFDYQLCLSKIRKLVS